MWHRGSVCGNGIWSEEFARDHRSAVGGRVVFSSADARDLAGGGGTRRAKMRRGVSVTAVQAGANPSVVVWHDGREERIFARLIVVADGRGSAARKWAGFSTNVDAHPFQSAGVLLTGVSGRRDMCQFVFNPEFGLVGGLVPQSKDRFRAYLGYPTDGSFSLNGARSWGRFSRNRKRSGRCLRTVTRRRKVWDLWRRSKRVMCGWIIRIAMEWR
jgi:2-polyprenyl-6-methoxyphenol hydroxylase-like FAD-dependent oxidoreductase